MLEQAASIADASTVASGAVVETVVVTTVVETNEMTVDVGAVSLSSEQERADFVASVQDASCAGMEGTCTVTLLSYRRRQLQARQLQSTVTLSVDRTYDYGASSNASTHPADLIEAALSSQGVTIQSSVMTGLSASTSVTVVGTDHATSGAAVETVRQSVNQALAEKLPDVTVTVEAAVVTPPLPPPSLPPRQPPSPPPSPGAPSRPPPPYVEAEKPVVTMVTIVWVVVGVASVLLLAAAAVLCRRTMRQRPKGASSMFEGVFPSPSAKARRSLSAAPVLPRHTRPIAPGSADEPTRTRVEPFTVDDDRPKAARAAWQGELDDDGTEPSTDEPSSASAPVEESRAPAPAPIYSPVTRLTAGRRVAPTVAVAAPALPPGLAYNEGSSPAALPPGIAHSDASPPHDLATTQRTASYRTPTHRPPPGLSDGLPPGLPPGFAPPFIPALAPRFAPDRPPGLPPNIMPGAGYLQAHAAPPPTNFGTPGYRPQYPVAQMPPRQLSGGSPLHGPGGVLAQWQARQASRLTLPPFTSRAVTPQSHTVPPMLQPGRAPPMARQDATGSQPNADGESANPPVTEL